MVGENGTPSTPEWEPQPGRMWFEGWWPIKALEYSIPPNIILSDN